MNRSHIHLQVYDVLKEDGVRKRAREREAGKGRRMGREGSRW